MCMKRYILTTWGFRRSPGCFLLATKRAEEEEKDEDEEEEEEEEEGWKTCRSSDFCSPDSLGPTQEAECLNTPKTTSQMFPLKPKHT